MTFALAIALAAAFQNPALSLPKKHLSPPPKPAAVVAKVGGVPITAADIESYLWDWRAYEIIQDAITHQMIAAEAKRQGVAVTDAEVQKALDERLAEVKKQLRPGQTLDQELREQGFTRSRLFLRLRSEQLLNKLLDKSFDPKDFIKVSTIIIRPQSEQATHLAEALQRAEAAYTALKNGEPWGDVLSRHSDDPSTIHSNGLLGWRELSAFPPTVQQEMATLKPGAITKPAQTTHGIQIFRVEAKGTSASGDVLKELKQAFVAGTGQRYLDDLRKRTKVEIFYGK